MEKQIIFLFSTNKKLKFNEIEKLLHVRSNKLDYHLKKLIKKKIIEKDNNGYYQLTDYSEYLIPYISEKNAILPVVLIKIGNKNRIFLYKRKKRPYKELFSLPGGRILVGENIHNAVKRIMKEKHNLDARLEKINSISIEHLKKRGKTINSFLLIFTTATVNTKEKLNLIDIEEYRKNIIKSDYNLIKRDNKKKIEITTINSLID